MRKKEKKKGKTDNASCSVASRQRAPESGTAHYATFPQNYAPSSLCPPFFFLRALLGQFILELQEAHKVRINTQSPTPAFLGKGQSSSK